MQDLIGRTLGHYRIVEQIGAGGMGVVYRAHDERLDRDVAIKVLPEEFGRDPDRLARFEREAKAVAKLAHPNILEIWDYGTEGGVTYAVTELLEGQSLREAMASGSITTGKTVEYSRAIAGGLAAAHSKGIIHRDLKPENVFLTTDGRIKILDFGLAKLIAADKDFDTEAPTAAVQTAQGGILGTVPYMAPEQVQGKPADHRSDVFSFGVVMYEMLTGRRPFGGSSPADTAAAILREDPEPISAASPGVPSGLAGVVDRCLEKRPEDRFSSAHDLELTLGAMDGDIAPQAEQGGSIFRERWLHIAAVVVAALIAVLFVLPPQGLFEKVADEPVPPPVPRIVVLPFENLGPPDQQYFADGVTEEITARLAAVGGLQVISRTSAGHYAKTEKTIPEIGRELDVGYVLEGTVRWAGDDQGGRVRVTPQLIRVGDDSHLWADSYDRVINDIFDVQIEIANSVAELLGVVLTASGEKGAETPPTENMDAYNAYLRGRYWASRPHFTVDNWERRMQAFEEAVERDPGFGLAHAELAYGHALARYYRLDLSSERIEAADASAARALDLASDDPRVHLKLSYYKLLVFSDVEGALTELKIAESGLSGSSEILEAKGDIFMVQGRWEEALEEFRAGLELSPLEADLVSSTAFVLWTIRRYPEALAASDEAIRLAPASVWPYLYKIMTLWSWHGRVAETRTVLEVLPSTAGDWETWVWYWQEMYEGRYEVALARLDSPTEGWVRIKILARPNALLAAFASGQLEYTEETAASYEVSRELLETEVEASPDDPRMHSSLGIVYAALGRPEDAVREGLKACELLPRSMDAFYYIPFAVDLAHIFTILGHNEAALEQLEDLLANPSWLSAPFLRMDPRWDPLRDDPRFDALLAKYEIEQ